MKYSLTITNLLNINQDTNNYKSSNEIIWRLRIDKSFEMEEGKVAVIR